ncbi:MAG: TolC family protein [Puniceicoccales bacterium]|jgi:cobalt-zinc-cadmium efflux system outer membrane protein|nr:TolC family protein [Puniceicoccales bacterium]
MKHNTLLKLSVFFLSSTLASAGAIPTQGKAPITAAPTKTTSLNKAVSLDALVASVVAANPESRFYENEIQLAQKRQKVTGRWADPELSVEIGRKSNRDAFGGSDGLAWGVTISQKFDFSGRNALRKAIAQCRVDRATAGLAQFRRELAAKATELGVALLAAQLRLETTEAVAARSRAVIETLTQRDPAGVPAWLEAQVVEADILSLAKSAAAQRAALLTALTELNLLRGAPPSAPLVLRSELPAFATAPEDARLVTTAFRENFTLRQFDADLREQGIAVDLETKNGYGDITLSPSYSEERAGGRERLFGIGVSIPLPFWNSNREGTAAARENLEQASLAVFKARRDLQKDIAAAAAEYRANLQFLAVVGAEKTARFRDAAEAGERHYRLGSIPVSTYLALQRAYLDAVDNYLSAISDAARAAAKLTALTGLPPESFFARAAAKTAPAPKISTVSPLPKTEKRSAQPVEKEQKKHDDAAHDDHDEKDAHGAGEKEKHDAPPKGTSFEKGRGLKLTPDAAAALAVRSSPASRISLPRSSRIVAQVFVADPAAPRAVALVSSEQARGIAVGARATIVNRSGAKEAVLTAIVTASEKASGRVELIFALPAGIQADVGGSVEMEIRSATPSPVIAIPRSALLDSAAGTFVYVAQGEYFLRVPVKKGATSADGAYVEITEGIAEGTPVVLSPPMQLWLTELRLTKGGGHAH